MDGPNNHLMLYRELYKVKKVVWKFPNLQTELWKFPKKIFFLLCILPKDFMFFFLFVCLSDLVNIQGIRGQLFKVNLYLINIHETLTVRND